MKNEYVRFYLFVLIATLFFGLCFTSTDFITTPIASIKDIIILAVHWLTIVIALFSLLLLLAVNKYIFTITFPLLTFVSSLLAYFRYTINATLTPMILDAALQNDYRTSAELVTSGLILFIIGSLIISIAFVYYRIKHVTVQKIYYPIGISVVLLLVFTQVDRFKRPISERIPFNIYYMVSKYWEEKQIISEIRDDLSEGLICTDEDLIVVFVLGESLRPDHLGFNGYGRNTTPLLDKEDIISFPNIYTEQTYTNRSVPHLLTRADSSNFNLAYKEKSFISLFNACDYYTAWLANQEAADTYVYFMNEGDTLIHVNIEKSPYIFDKWVDTDLIPLFDNILEKSNNKKFMLLHTIGSHWWYNSHFTDEFEQYKPIAKSRMISSNSQEEMINSYDNTVLFTDYFIFNLIERIRNKRAILIYQSDHGEALGEDGIWLHASETPFTHKAAGFVWMSSSYKETFPEHYENAHNNRFKPFRTDYLFHSILDAANIKSPYLNDELSIFK